MLIEGVLAAEPEAFDSFYDLTFPSLYAFAVRETASREEAQRLCREIYEAVLEALPEARGAVAVEAWLLGKAKEAARVFAAGRGRRQTLRVRRPDCVAESATK